MKQKGFSLVEILLVLSIISMVAVAAFVSFRRTNSDALAQEAQATVLHAFEKARSRALSGVGDTDHGVHLKEKSVVLFEGDAYIPGQGTEFLLPLSVTSNQTNATVIFQRLTGEATGDVPLPLTVILSQVSGITYSIDVTHEGTIFAQ